MAGAAQGSGDEVEAVGPPVEDVVHEHRWHAEDAAFQGLVGACA